MAVNIFKKYQKNSKYIFFVILIFLCLISFIIFSYIGYKLGQNPNLLNNIFKKTNQTQDNFMYKDEEIINMILTDIPQLKKGNQLSEFEIVNALREWVYANVPVVSDTKLLLTTIENTSSAANVPLGRRLYDYKNGLAGAWCAGTAATLSDIYNLFGFETYKIDYGDIYKNSRKATHAITLVKIKDKDKNILSIQDAYFNQIYVDRLGNPLDYFEMLELLKHQKADQIIVMPGQNQLKPRLIAKDVKIDSTPEKIYPNGNKLIRQEFTLPDFEIAAKDFLVKQKFPANILYLNSFPYNTYGKDLVKTVSLLNRARAISGTWCYSDGNCLGLSD